MSKQIFFFFLIIFYSCSLLAQNLSSLTIDTNLTNTERTFKDSISRINEKNAFLLSSRESYNFALELFNQQSFQQAIIHFTNAIAIDSTFFEAYLYRGKSYAAINDSLAILDYRTAFSIDSTNLTPLYDIAKFQEGFKILEAIETYDIILSLNYKESNAHYNKGVLLYLQQDIEGALRSFTNSINISKDARVFNDRGSCYRLLGKYELAINDYITAIALNSDLAFIYNNLASLYRKKGDFTKALNYYSLAIKKDANYLLAYNNRGSLYIDLNYLDSALYDIDQAISLHDEYAPAYNNKALIYHQKKQYTEALYFFDKAILLNSNYAKAYFNRGITRQMLRDEEGACNDWITAKELGISVANKYLDNDCY